jgi:hypothetical protein
MGYWTQRDQDGPPKSSEGWHHYTVTKVMRGTDKRDFSSRDGDPQILVVLSDEEGAEATTMFTLSDKASWVLARFLARSGVNLEDLDQESVSLTEWEDQKFASRWLDGLKVWANCEHQHGDQGKVYTRLSFFHENEVPGNALGKSKSGAQHDGSAFADGTPVPDDEEIPF